MRLETELQATKVRLAQAEGQLRGRERELGRLAELLRQTQGAEYEAWIKTAKVEEGAAGGGHVAHGGKRRTNASAEPVDVKLVWGTSDG